MYQLAEQYQAAMVDVEHRFYGESFPTQTVSAANYAYLSSQQALADLARVISFVTDTQLDSPNSKVLTFGGSYPGNLAGWFRLKYPAITTGSVASSAPVTAELDYSQYMDVVAYSVRFFGGQQCYDMLQLAAEQIWTTLSTNSPGSAAYTQLETDFETCAPMESVYDVYVFLSDMMGNVQGVAQYSKYSGEEVVRYLFLTFHTFPYIFFVYHTSGYNVTEMCNFLTAVPEQDAYTQFVAFSTQFYSPCIDVSWNNSIAYLANTTADPSNAARPWVFQTCNEFGYAQTANSPNQPFHSWAPVLNVSMYMLMCQQSYMGFGTNMPQIDWINDVYGSAAIGSTNTVFPTGSVDPWHALGVTNKTQALYQASDVKVDINGTSHCEDMYAPNPLDPPALTYGRTIIASTVAAWLSDTPTPPPAPAPAEDCGSDDDALHSKGTQAGVFIAVIVVSGVLGAGIMYVLMSRGKPSLAASDGGSRA